MSKIDTGFVIEAVPISPSFQGTPQEFFVEMLRRMKITSPFGITTFVNGSVKPSSNRGPWLKDGIQWWVWSDQLADYVPLDITQSQIPAYWVQEDIPPTSTPSLWFRTRGTSLAGIFLYFNGGWRSTSAANSGTTLERPSTPGDLEQYYDTDTNCLIWWERGKWRTVSGTPGDLKFVKEHTLETALRVNPGWAEVNEQSWRGRTIIAASKNPGATPTTDLPVDAGITKRAQGDLVGVQGVIITVPQLPPHSHKSGFHYDEYTGINATPGDQFLAPSGADVDPLGPGNAVALTDGNDYSNPLIDATNAPLSVMQPSVALWLLFKE